MNCPLLIAHCPLLIVLAVSCRHAPSDSRLQGNYYTPQYAQGFCIDTADGEKILTVANPFQQAQQQKYTYRIDAEPMQRIVCMSTTHLGFTDFIGKNDVVVGVSAAQYIYNPALQAAYRNGAIAEVGYEANLNTELILQLHPDAVLAYGVYNEFEQSAQKLQELGIRVIYIGEYVEPHPLGKAEWVVAIAALLGCEDMARTRFEYVEKQYLALANLLPADVRRTSCLLNAPWNDTWFMPAMQSNMAQYLHDAGGTSVIPLREGSGTLPESIENVYAHSQNAECWLNAGNAPDLVSLGQMHKLIAKFPVYASGKIYNHNNRSTPQGGSDFFESGAVSPHLILADLIHILHPDILPQHNLYYYRQVE